jgi:tetratricopeptide (TPR) repeat protein
MSSRIPVTRQISWLAVLPQVAAGAAAGILGWLLAGRYGLMWGGAVYLLYSVGSRRLFPQAHRAGIKLMRQERFEQAIPKFQESVAFFERYPWVDRFRSIVLMSPSAISYREMALVNMAFCYTQIGNGEQGRLIYQKCLERFPNSGIAASALRMLDSVAQGELQTANSAH